MTDAVAAEPPTQRAPAWSPELLLLFRPATTYARLRAEAATPDGPTLRWRAARGPLLWLLVAGAFVSLTTAGRLVWWEMLLSASAWAFFPALQIAWLAVASRRVALPFAARVDLYFRGQAPLYLWSLAVAALCLFTPHARLAFEALLFPILASLALAAAWSTFLTFACFRAGFGLTRGAALWRTLVFYLGYASTMVGWFLLTDNLQPLLSARP